MLGIYDSIECPVDLERFGERSGSGDSLEEFRKSATSHFFGATPGFGPRYPLEPDTRELVKPDADVKIYAREQKLRVNKAVHRIRFENETENDVTVVIEPKNQVSG